MRERVKLRSCCVRCAERWTLLLRSRLRDVDAGHHLSNLLLVLEDVGLDAADLVLLFDDELLQVSQFSLQGLHGALGDSDTDTQRKDFKFYTLYSSGDWQAMKHDEQDINKTLR